MTFKQLIPTLRTNKLEETIEFYETHLGFECTTHDEDWKFASLSRDNVTIQLAAADARFPFHEEGIFQHSQLTGSLYIYLDEVDELWEQLKDKVKIYYHLQDFEYGMREFAIYDNNGYLIQFGSQIQSSDE